MIYALIENNRGTLSISNACQTLRISRDAFYHWQSGRSLGLDRAEADLRDEIEDIIAKFPGYGYRRVAKELARQGVVTNHKRVLRVMRENNLLVKIKKRFIPTTDSDHAFQRYPNLIKELVVSHLDQVWLADITYIRLEREFVYLAVILDALSRKVVGWHLLKEIDTSLTKAALEMAIKARQPSPGLIHHSDQGVQYAAYGYVELLKRHGIAISMSAKASPQENAKAESFFATLKREEVYLFEYESFSEAKMRIVHFIEDVYNQKRLHSSIGYIPPIEFEDQFLSENPSILVVGK